MRLNDCPNLYVVHTFLNFFFQKYVLRVNLKLMVQIRIKHKTFTLLITL